MKKQGYLKGALIISVGGLISKILGAVYRIPLIAFLGGDGMGIYQMVYPLYCILLTISASGIPTGIARLISSGQEGAEKKAFSLYSLIGLIGSLTMYAFAFPLCVLQGEEAVEVCCKLLSPSVFFVSVLSVVRGYYQGKGNMYPTAVTEVMEQLIKVFLGTFLAWMNRGNTAKAVAAAIFAVTISEGFSSLFAIWLYLRRDKGIKPLFKVRQTGYKDILKYTLPLTFTALAMPLSQLAESIVIVNILRTFDANATAIYGIYSGCAVTIINLPVSLSYGLAAASVPKISPLAENGDKRSAFKECKKCLWLTFFISLPCAVALYVFAPLAARLFFNSLAADDKLLLIKLVRIMAVNAITLSLTQTSSACLTSLGKPIYGTITGWVSAILRVLLSAVLIKFTSLSISGAAISANCCYLVAVLLNFWYIAYVNKKWSKRNEDNFDRTGDGGKRFNSVGKMRT